MTITKEQLDKLPDELILKAVNACMEYETEYGETVAVNEVRTEVKEKLNAKKKVDYSVLIKHKIDCVDIDGVIFKPDVMMDFKPYPRTNHWFSALNFDDPIQVAEDLREAGFDIDTSINDDLKINGAAEGREW